MVKYRGALLQNLFSQGSYCISMNSDEVIEQGKEKNKKQKTPRVEHRS